MVDDQVMSSHKTSLTQEDIPVSVYWLRITHKSVIHAQGKKKVMYT